MKIPFLKHILVITLIGSILALGYLGKLTPIINILDSDELAMTVGNFRISVYIVIKMLLALILIVWAARTTSDFAKKRIRNMHSISRGNKELLIKGFQIMLYVICFLVALDVIGIDLTALTVFSGAVGIGLGFGLQKITSNFISGLILLVEKSIEVDDLVELTDGISGYVRNTGARYTLLETFDGREVMIPNEDFITSRVINLTYSSNIARVQVDVGVSYKSDLEIAHRLMVEAAKAHPMALKDPEPSCFLRTFGDSAVNFTLYFWIADVTQGRYAPQHDVMMSIWNSFKKHQIEIPYAQREVTIHYAKEKNSKITKKSKSKSDIQL